MWFEERSWASNQKMSTLIEKWRDLWSYKIEYFVAASAYVFATTNFLNLPKLVLDNGGCKDNKKSYSFIVRIIIGFLENVVL